MKLIKPKFWDKQYLTLQSLILYPFTFILDLRNLNLLFNKPKKFSDIKTICVGNIYLGGTGKTPLVDCLAKILKKKFRSAIIKKEYQSHLDEKLLLEQNNKVFFKKDRNSSLLDAVRKKFELAIFDDGLQDNKIEYDLKIVCFNSITLAGNGLRLPAGPLRERLNSLLKYDAVFITGYNKNKEFEKKLKKINPDISIFHGEYISTNFHIFKKYNYLVFCGIGNPLSFTDTLKKYKIRYKKKIIFPDHYNYSEEDLQKINKIAKDKTLKLLTTEKDFHRIPRNYRKNINYLKIDLKIKKKQEFNKFIMKFL